MRGRLFRIALGAVSYRLHQIAQEFNVRLEGRVDERTRIARDLHDTLLQSFHGLLMRFQAVQNLLPGRVADARQVLETALDDAAQGHHRGARLGSGYAVVHRCHERSGESRWSIG